VRHETMPVHSATVSMASRRLQEGFAELTETQAFEVFRCLSMATDSDATSFIDYMMHTPSYAAKNTGHE